MEYEIIAGKKAGSKLLFLSDKQLFQMKSKNQAQSITYYDCYNPACKTRVKVENGHCTYISTTTHTHGSQELLYQQLKLENTIKLRCNTEKKGSREIFDQECSLNQKASANLQYARRHRSYKVHQSTGIPKNPNTIDEVKPYFENTEILSKISMTLHDEPREFYTETIITGGFAYVIFSSEIILEDLPDVRRFRIDGTFKCVPRGPFKQLLIISVDFSNHSFPNFFVLMNRKTQAAYSHLFRTIENRWKLKPISITTDYEKAMRNALAKQYPGATLIGCWFHFTQAVQRKASKIKGFFRLIRTDNIARRIYHKFLCLPLMRSDHIFAAFKLLKDEANEIYKGKFTQFLNYMEQQWMKREGPQSISVFKELQRTNNPMESYNSKLNSKIQPKGCFYKFIEVLRAEELKKSREYNIIRNGGNQVYHPQPRQCKEKNELIFTIQDQFGKGNLTIAQFFRKAADIYETDLDDNFESDEEIESDTDDEDNYSYNENCTNCQSQPKSIMFLPCNHLKFCSECVKQHLVPRENEFGLNILPKCPICQVVITGHVHVYLW